MWLMFNTHQNFHHSKLPKLGAIVELPSGSRGIVVAFPLCDNVLPYSIGIHTCFVQRLDTGHIFKISGTWVFPND